MGQTVKEKIESLYEAESKERDAEFDVIFAEFIDGLNRGLFRAAERVGGEWKVNAWVKKGILLGFRYGEIRHFFRNEIFSFSDKQTYPTRSMEDAKNVRVVPGGTSIRTGTYIGENVVIMPPAYINTGSYIGSNTLVDSHVLVGSCAQIGSNIHLSAGTQIGGVLEPVGALPVIIEDDALIGGNCGIYEGTIVKKGAVIGAGTILTSSIPVYDLIRQKVIRAGAGTPLVIPSNAVVVPGSRPITAHDFAKENGLHIYCGIIIKYKDDRTAAATTLEDDLRPSDKPDFTR